MKKEYAIINHGIEDAPYHNEDVILETQDTKEILDWITNAKEDGTDTSEYTIEEYAVNGYGEFYEGSDFYTLENFQNRYGTNGCMDTNDMRDEDESDDAYSDFYRIGEKEYELYQAASGDWCVSVHQCFKENDHYSIGKKEDALAFILSDYAID